MFGGSMVEHHIEHDIDSPLLCLFRQFLEIFHRAIAGVEAAVVLYIVTVVFLRRDRHRVKPDIIDAQILQIIQA